MSRSFPLLALVALIFGSTAAMMPRLSLGTVIATNPLFEGFQAQDFLRFGEGVAAQQTTGHYPAVQQYSIGMGYARQYCGHGTDVSVCQLATLLASTRAIPLKEAVAQVETASSADYESALAVGEEFALFFLEEN